MAAGDLDDIMARIRAVLPAGWFPDKSENATPVLEGVLAGLAWPWTLLYTVLEYGLAQSRLQTSTGNFVDMFAADHFGESLPRESGESDADYVTRIRDEIVGEKNTRPALEAQVATVTPSAQIIEPWRAPDCACIGRAAYGAATSYYGSRSAVGNVFMIVPAGTDTTALSSAIVKTKAEGIDMLYAVTS